MKMIVLLVVFMLATGCDRSDSTKAGWHYNPIAPQLEYRVQRQGTLKGAFLGVGCQSSIVFIVEDGGNDNPIHSFTVSAGGWRKTYRALGSAAGLNLMFPLDFPSSDGDRLAARLGAGQGITIRADDGWTMSVPGDPIVGQFVRDCGVVNAKRRALDHL